MTARRIVRVLGALVVTSWAALLGAPVPVASAQPCPDVEVMFARGTAEPPGVGGIGQAFVDAMRTQVGGKSMDVYPINYPASADFASGMDFALTVVAGDQGRGRPHPGHCGQLPQDQDGCRRLLARRDRSRFRHLGRCPRRSTGRPRAPTDAARGGQTTSRPWSLFGAPSDNFMRDAGAPTVVIGPLYVPKTISLCADGDTICNGAPPGPPNGAHGSYGDERDGQPGRRLRGQTALAAVSHYKANVRDLEFNLFEVLDLEKALATGEFGDLDGEAVREMLAEAARLAQGPLAESFADGDRNPPEFDPDSHAVRLPESFKASVRAWQEAGWPLLGLDEATRRCARARSGELGDQRVSLRRAARRVLLHDRARDAQRDVPRRDPATAALGGDRDSAQLGCDDGTDRTRRRLRRRIRPYACGRSARRHLAYRRHQAVHHVGRLR